MTRNTEAYFKGKGNWFIHLDTPEQWKDDKFWSVVLYPDVDSLEALRDLQAKGMKNMIKKDDNGYYIKFKCPVTRVYSGKTVAFPQPSCVDADGVSINPRTVGTGSDVTVKLEVYEHKTPGGGKANAVRLRGVRIDHLLPFEVDKEYTSEEKAALEGLLNQPQPF